MDRRGRLAQPLTWIAPRTARATLWSLAVRLAQRVFASILKLRVPRGAGLVAALLVIAATVIYGAITGDHLPAIVAALKDARDQAADKAGFAIMAVTVSGTAHVSRDEVLKLADVTGRTSLLFLDVEEAREGLRTSPWIADASVLKLYPGELQIGITEREPFAVWQTQGKLFVVAADGTVLEPYAAPRFLPLPLVVGRGADKAARDFLALLGRYPEIRDQVRASVLVGERRWNLRLRNGLDVRLPEVEAQKALERLAALDHDLKLISRDITVIDLRLADRVTVRLSPAAGQARSDALKKKLPAKKGDNA
jgi:cell division protein FtsQ